MLVFGWLYDGYSKTCCLRVMCSLGRVLSVPYVLCRQAVNGPRCAAPAGRGFLPHPGLASYPASLASAPAAGPPRVSAPAGNPAVRPQPPLPPPPRPGLASRGSVPAPSALPTASSDAAAAAAVTAPASSAADRRPSPGLATHPPPAAVTVCSTAEAPLSVAARQPPAPAAPSPAPGRARFAVRDLVSPSAAAAPVAAAGPPPPGRNNGCSPAPATLPTASAAGRPKPPRHKVRGRELRFSPALPGPGRPWDGVIGGYLPASG